MNDDVSYRAAAEGIRVVGDHEPWCTGDLVGRRRAQRRWLSVVPASRMQKFQPKGTYDLHGSALAERALRRVADDIEHDTPGLADQFASWMEGEEADRVTALARAVQKKIPSAARQIDNAVAECAARRPPLLDHQTGGLSDEQVNRWVAVAVLAEMATDGGGWLFGQMGFQ